jgi:3-isopropylmalate dehydrogenase
MLLDELGRASEARRLEAAVASVVREGKTTRDLGGSLSTSQVGDAIRARLRG